MINNLIVMSACLVRDITRYYDYFEVVTPMRLNVGDRFRLNINDDKSILEVLSSYMSGTAYINVCVTKEQADLLRCSLEPMFFDGKVSDLLKRYGLESSIKYSDAGASYQLTFGGIKALIKELNDTTQISNGGAPFFYIATNGVIGCTDLKYEYENKDNPTPLKYLPTADTCLTDWMTTTPCKVEMIKQTIDGTERVNIDMDDYGLSAKYIFADHSGKNWENRITAVKNDFYRKKYRSRHISFIDSFQLARIGYVVDLLGAKGVIDYYKYTIPMGSEVPSGECRMAAPYK